MVRILTAASLICILLAGCNNGNTKVARTPDSTTNPDEPNVVATDPVADTENQNTNESTPAEPKENASEPAETFESIDEPSEMPNEEPSEPTETESHDDAVAADGDSTETNVEPAEVAEAPAPVEPTRERLLLLPPNGPIIIELLLTQGSESLVDSWHANTAKVVELIDTDEDGKTTWDELMENQSLLRMAFGNLNLEGDQARTIIRSYDSNTNDLVEPEEFTRFLGRNQRNVGELVIDSVAFDPFKKVAQSGIRMWLDKNGDGVLSNEDKQNAAHRLMMRDADEDRRLFAVDFSGAAAVADMANPNQAMMQQYRRRGPEPVRILHDDLDWGQLRVDMEEIYAFGGSLTEQDFGDSAEIFSSLDEDGDEVLSTSEIALLMDVPAHVTIAVDRSSNQIAKDALPEPEVADTDDSKSDTDSDEEEEAYNLAMMYQAPPSSQLNVGYRALLLEISSVASRSSNYGELDKVFAAMDRDKNMYLNMQEYLQTGLAQVATFEEADRDDNSEVNKEELGKLFEFISAYENSGLVVSIRPNDDPVFAVLDTNRSGQLEAREIKMAGEQLDSLDKNKDGRLSSVELPSTLTVTLRGRQPYNRNQLVANVRNVRSAAPTPKATETTPAWFKQMDRNQDGEIDPTEFLGDRDAFDKLDRDSDGFFESDEIETPENETSESETDEGETSESETVESEKAEE